MSVISGKALQEQVEDLERLCPVLLPCMAPKGFQDEDLMRLSMTQGSNEQRQLEEMLAGAARSCRSCCTCAAAGTAATSSTPCQEDETSVLRFTTFPKVNFADKTIKISSGGFACGQCRAMADAWRLLRFSAVKVGASKPEREELLRQLCLHFAAVNRVSDELMASGDLVVAWVQEVFSRAYSLHVLASNISGWKHVGQDGQVQLGGAVKLAKLLLKPSEDEAPRKRKKKQEPVPAMEPEKPTKKKKTAVMESEKPMKKKPVASTKQQPTLGKSTAGAKKKTSLNAGQ